MIRVCHVHENGTFQRGDDALIDLWRQQAGNLWIDIQSTHFEQKIKDLLIEFGGHPFGILDASRENHPPKIEVFSDHTLLIFTAIERHANHLNSRPIQLTFFVMESVLISLHASHTESIEQAWSNHDLAKLILDPQQLSISIMQHCNGLYLETLLSFDEDLQTLEDQMLNHGTDLLLKQVMQYRSQLSKLLRVFKYHDRLAQDLIHHWEQTDRDPNTLELRHRARDFYDRCERLASLTHQYYDLCRDLVEGYISLSSHQLNQTMKLLTSVTVIFVPLSFLAGLYGMNFEYMPELHIHGAYFILLGIMLLLATMMILFFRRKGWF